MVNWYMKQCSTSLIIREKQVKTTMDIALHLLEWVSSITWDNKCVEDVENRGPVWTLSGSVNWCSNSVEVLQKIKNRTTIWSMNSIFEFISERKKSLSQRNISTPSMFIVALLTVYPRYGNKLKCPWIDIYICIYVCVYRYIYIYMNILQP